MVKKPETREALSDDELLRAVAERRDETAFAELFARYQQPAFNLASHLTGSQALGQEALQEAMWRVWVGAHTFQPGGSLRAWLLRIVAREALRSVKTRHRHARKMVSDFDLTAQTAGGAEAAGGEEKYADREAAQALRQQVEQLDPVQRRLLALYFCVGFSQREISEILGISQQAVSHKLDETVASLRRRLTQIGFVSASIPRMDLLIGAVLDTWHATPSDLRASCLERLNQQPGRLPGLARPPSVASAAYLGGAVLLAALAGAGGWWALQTQAERSVEDAGKAPSPLKTPPLPGGTLAGGSEELREAVWDFSERPADGFRVIWGSWSWQRTKAGGGMLANGLVALLPFPIRPRPLLIETELLLDARNLAKELQIWQGVYWVEEYPDRFEQPGRLHYKIEHHESGQTVRLRHYVLGRYIIILSREVCFSVERYDKAYPAANLMVTTSSRSVRRITARELRPEEIPQRLRDPEVLIREMKIPGEMIEKRIVPKKV